MKEGFRVWEIGDKTKVPKEIFCSCNVNKLESMLRNEKTLDLDNKTYAIRIGEDGLR